MFNLLPLIFSRLANRCRGDKGEVSLEYALVGGLMAAAIVGGIGGLTGALGGWFTGIGDAITAALP